jgi:hypothetical protein
MMLRVTTIVTLLLVANLGRAQELSGISGMPGDSIPDIYYFAHAGTVQTTFGSITRLAGTLTIDIDLQPDGLLITEIAIGGADVSAVALGCDLCDGSLLPFGSSVTEWVASYENGATAWRSVADGSGLIRGFAGVIGTGYFGNDFQQVHDWPSSDNFPSFGLADYGIGQNFTDLFTDSNGDNWQAKLATIESTILPDVIFTNVTLVPEPNSRMLFVGLFSILYFARMPTSPT